MKMKKAKAFLFHQSLKGTLCIYKSKEDVTL